MAGNTLDTAPAVRRAICVTFSWGAGPTVSRYIRSDDNVTISGHVFTAIQVMDVVMGKQHGGIKDVPVTIRMLATLSPLDKLIRPTPWAPVTCEVGEINLDDLTSYRVVFRGDVIKTRKNASGYPGIAAVEVWGYKWKLQVPMGIQAQNTCPWSLGDANCRVDLTVSAFTETHTITAINANVITVNALTIQTQDWWTWGSAQIDGLKMLITAYTASSLDIQLYTTPPPEWNGVSVKLVAGCDKLPKTCRVKFNNQIRFCGLGVAMPIYNPQIESP